jgi:RHS repeat-associated protein
MMITFRTMSTVKYEKGLYYCGARYYDPKISVRLSVDPLAHEYPGWTPYHFVHSNPLNLVDPWGMNAWKPGAIEGTWVAEPGDGAETLAQDAGISRAKAYRLMDEQGYGTYVDKDGVTKSAVDPGDLVTLNKASSTAPLSEPSIDLSRKVVVPQIGSTGGSDNSPRESNPDYKKRLNGVSLGLTIQSTIIKIGTEGQVANQGLKTLNTTTTWLGRGMGAYNAYSLIEDYQAGNIGDVRFFSDQASNAAATFGGPIGAAWGVGWESGRAFTNKEGYQSWKRQTWLPFWKEVSGN